MRPAAFRRSAKPILLGAAGFVLAWALTLPSYHHALGLVRGDCADCLAVVFHNTQQLLRAERARAAEQQAAKGELQRQLAGAAEVTSGQ